MSVQHFSRDVLPSRIGTWKQFCDKSQIRMVRIEGPFVVETKDGEQRCSDGWLAIDHRSGYPYAISARDHRQHFEEVRRDGADQDQPKEA